MRSADWILWIWNPETSSNVLEEYKKARNATEVHTIVVTGIKEQQIDVDRYSSRVWFGKNVTEDIYKCRFTYRPMAKMARTERGISIMIFICWNTQEIWDMEEAGIEKQHINHITLEILYKFVKKQRLTPRSYDTTNRVLSTY